MKALVSGALGFIGSFLCERLLEDGHFVTGVDDGSGNVVESIDGMETIRGDIGRVSLGKFKSYDLFIHCASPVGAVGLLPYQGLIAADIATATLAMANGGARYDIPLLNVSSSEVYGKSGLNRESDALVVPGVRRNARLEYAVGKIAGEFTVANMPGLHSVTVRPFNVVGPRQSRAKGFVLPTFIEQASGGAKLTIFGDGMQRRALTAVQDLVGFMAGLPLSAYQTGGRVLNVGNPRNETTITALAYRVLRAVGREADETDVTFTSGPAVWGPAYAEAEGRLKLPDVTLAGELGWSPELGLNQIVELALREHRVPAA